jgi:hypothetical protein
MFVQGGGSSKIPHRVSTGTIIRRLRTLMISHSEAIGKDPVAQTPPLWPSRPPSDALAERITTDSVAKHLELCGYQLIRKPPRQGHGTP